MLPQQTHILLPGQLLDFNFLTYVSFHFHCLLLSSSHSSLNDTFFDHLNHLPLKIGPSNIGILGAKVTQFFPRFLSIAREACHVAKIIQKPGHPNYKDPVIYEIGKKFPRKAI
jgi:hypothetical protein